MVYRAPFHVFAYSFLVLSAIGIVSEPQGWVLWLPLSTVSLLILWKQKRWPFDPILKIEEAPKMPMDLGEILKASYDLRDALNPYLRTLHKALQAEGIPEKDINIQLYSLVNKLDNASSGFQPAIITLTLAYTLQKFLDETIRRAAPEYLQGTK